MPKLQNKPYMTNIFVVKKAQKTMFHKSSGKGKKQCPVKTFYKTNLGILSETVGGFISILFGTTTSGAAAVGILDFFNNCKTWAMVVAGALQMYRNVS